MIVPSIDLMGGRAVQLVGGKGEPRIVVVDVMELAARFSRVGEIAVIDIDAAKGKGENSALIKELCARFRCRVGGGIRDGAKAREYLDAGAARVIIGTKATPEFLSALPRERVIAAVDVDGDEVLAEGWQARTGRKLLETVAGLAPYVSGFLVTFVDREGRLGGTDVARVEPVLAAAGGVRVTVAGGISEKYEIAALDRMGADSQVGMAVYSGKMSIAEAFAAPLSSDRSDGLWPTVVCDERGFALGLVYSNMDSLKASLETGQGHYWSRKRGLWRKGAVSGAVQEVLSVVADCDRDSLRFTVRQGGAGFCHSGSWSCFGSKTGLGRLEETVRSRLADAPEGSYTRRLFTESGLLESKIMEEAGELVRSRTKEEAAWEATDLLYFAMVDMARKGATLGDVERELDRRALAVTRRRGDAKPSTAGIH